jgi:predicted  nucleic acid-binding Zn-ribbon protein
MSDKLNALSIEHRRTLDHEKTLEHSLSVSKNNCYDLEKLISGFQNEITLLREKLSVQISLSKEHIKKYENCQKDVQELEAQKLKLNQTVHILNEKISLTKEKLISTENSLQNHEQKDHSLLDELKSAGNEILKANEIIKKLQQDLKQLKIKLKLKSQILAQQESLLSERQNTIDTNIRDQEQLKLDLQRTLSENEKLKSEMTNLNLKLEENVKVLNDNQHGNCLLIVIEWLHKQLNDEAVKKPATYTPYVYDERSRPASGFKPTSVYKMEESRPSSSKYNFNDDLIANQTARPSSTNIDFSKYSVPVTNVQEQKSPQRNAEPEYSPFSRSFTKLPSNVNRSERDFKNRREIAGVTRASPNLFDSANYQREKGKGDPKSTYF